MGYRIAVPCKCLFKGACGVVTSPDSPTLPHEDVFTFHRARVFPSNIEAGSRFNLEQRKFLRKICIGV
jgi:hypothetical protein